MGLKAKGHAYATKDDYRPAANKVGAIFIICGASRTEGSYGLFVLGSRYRGQPVMLTEVGGFLLIPSDIPAEARDMLYKFYGSFNNSEELAGKYRDLMEGIASLQFVVGFCYTQLTDIEQEVNAFSPTTAALKSRPNRSRIFIGGCLI